MLLTQDSSRAMNLPTRRQAIAGIAMAFGGLAAGSPSRAHVQQQMQEAQSTGIEGLLTYLHQEVTIKASPQRLRGAAGLKAVQRVHGRTG